MKKNILYLLHFIVISLFHKLYLTTMTPDGSYLGSNSHSITPYDSSESTNNTFGQDWNNFGQWVEVIMKKTYLALAPLITVLAGHASGWGINQLIKVFWNL